MKPTGPVIIFSITIVLMSALTAGCVETAGEAVCANMPPGETRDHCYQKVAVESGDIEYCNQIEEAGPASKCYIYLAEKSPYYCEEMEKMRWYGMQGAYDTATCYQYVAQKTQFGDYCTKIPPNYVSWGNDLTPGGASLDRGFTNLGCGLPGNSPCRTSVGGLKSNLPY